MTEFDQSAWLSPYINFNTDLRIDAKNDFEKDFFKLMNSSVLGKTMENIKKHKDIKLVTNKKAYLRKVMKPNFKSGILFSESRNEKACVSWTGYIRFKQNPHV